MASEFKRKYKPDSLSQSISLDDHLGAADPHNQYALKTDIIGGSFAIDGFLNYVRKRNLLDNYSGEIDGNNNPRNEIVAINVIQEINALLNSVDNTVNNPSTGLVTYVPTIQNNASTIGTHRTRYTQAQALNQLASGERTDHLDNEDKNLYAARTHTHTYSDVGASRADHTHDDLYSPLGHTHDYADKDHNHPEYVLYTDLSEVGIYRSSVNVMSKINNSESEYTNNCNNPKYLIQGSFYLNPTPTYQKVETSSWYEFTSDETFQSEKQYYTFDGTNYVQATVTVGGTIPADTYYEFKQTTFQAGVSYYTKNQETGVYTPAFVTIGADITGTYYTRSDNSIENGPAGVDSGFLVVRSSTDPSSPSGNIIQVLYAPDMAWKREIAKHSVVNYIVSYDDTFIEGKTYYISVDGNYVEAEVTVGETIDGTYYEMSIDNTTYTFGEWMPLVETVPIGSLMFSNRDDTPRGYVEANGSSVNSKSYPLLWEFAIESGQIVAYDKWVGLNDGCYSFDVDQQLSSKVIQSGDKDTDLCVEAVSVAGYTDYRFVRLTSSNISSFVGLTLRIFNKSSIDTNNGIKFYLPNLGGNFLKMWAGGSSDVLGANVEAGLPNIKGSIGESYSAEPYQPIGFPILSSDYRGALNYHDTGANRASAFTSTDNTGGKTYSLSFDASKGTTYTSGSFMTEANSPYGKSDTVTPKNISIKVFIKAYNGSLIHQDVTAESIQSIVVYELSKLGYATTDVAGFVKLATPARIANPTTDDETYPSVVTAKQLHDTNVNNVKQIVLNGEVYTPTSNIVILPDLAEELGNRVVINSRNTIECTAILDIATASNIYEDFVIPGNIVDRLINSGSNFDAASVTMSLKCLNSANALGYPAGAIVPNPICSQKPNNETEYMSHPSVTIFTDEITYADATAGSVSTKVKPSYTYSLTNDETFQDGKVYYTKSNGRYELATVVVDDVVTENTYYEKSTDVVGGTATNNRIVVRLYWPLMWYIKRFTPAVDDGSKTFPLIPDDTSSMTDEQIVTRMLSETSYWSIILKIAL